MLNYGAVIISHNHLQELESSNLLTLADEIFRCVVVVDNMSCPDLKSICANKGIIYLANEERKGFSANANLGAKTLFREFDVNGVAFINPDVEIVAFDSEKFFQKEGLPPICMPRVVDKSNNPVDVSRSYPSLTKIIMKVFSLVLKTHHSEKVSETDFRWMPGFFLIADKTSFDDCGGFDEGYRLYLEDADIACSLWMCGYQPEVLGCMTIKHEGGFLSRKILSKAFWWHICSYARFWSKWGYFKFRGTDARS